MRFRTIALASGALLTTTLLLAGCAQNGTGGGMPGMDHGATPMTTPSAGIGDFNSADEMFVTGMIPHHLQAIQMADLILGTDGVDPRVLDLAQQIKDAQGPEIETMTSWLAEWGIPYDDSTSQGMGGMDHGDGMLSEADLIALESATGIDATRLFLEGMIGHHQGAVRMAQSVIDNGQNPDVADLAQQILVGQTAEIATMQDLLGTL
ncbi:DUF305 domain-containing protein [Pseudolysinimonas sp.]|uniref:DUF305 domain-containing protein n=1 Tax=Pseudolysinimonas sp. TaxID=2680009 RepID=UPI00286A3FE9|nr:DUF305 domain-containing protein [Pseudolysinimonas sp.]